MKHKFCGTHVQKLGTTPEGTHTLEIQKDEVLLFYAVAVDSGVIVRTNKDIDYFPEGMQELLLAAIADAMKRNASTGDGPPVS